MGRIYVDKYTGRLERTDVYLVKLTLKDGSVIEEGNHEQLLERRGFYYGLYHSQFS